MRDIHDDVLQVIRRALIARPALLKALEQAITEDTDAYVQAAEEAKRALRGELVQRGVQELVLRLAERRA